MVLYRVAEPKAIQFNVFVDIDECGQRDIPEDANFKYFYFDEKEIVPGTRSEIVPGLNEAYRSEQNYSWYFRVQRKIKPDISDKLTKQVLSRELMEELETLTPERYHQFHIHLGDKTISRREDKRAYLAVMPCNGNCIRDSLLESWVYDAKRTAIVKKDEEDVLAYIKELITEDRGYIIAPGDGIDETTGRIVVLMHKDFKDALLGIERYNTEKYQKYKEMQTTGTFKTVESDRRRTNKAITRILRKKGLKREKEDLEFLERREED